MTTIMTGMTPIWAKSLDRLAPVREMNVLVLTDLLILQVFQMGH